MGMQTDLGQEPRSVLHPKPSQNHHALISRPSHPLPFWCSVHHCFLFKEKLEPSAPSLCAGDRAEWGTLLFSGPGLYMPSHFVHLRAPVLQDPLTLDALSWPWNPPSSPVSSSPVQVPQV